MLDYLRDPAAIARASEAAVRAAVDLGALPPGLQPLALRLVHACGMPEVVADLAYSDADAADHGMQALAQGRPVLVDAFMVAQGIRRDRLPAENDIVCTLEDDGVAERARSSGQTRSAAAVELWPYHLAGAVVAIGNAPTALFRLLELLDDGAPKPALVLGFPVGFIGAVESKAALIDRAGDLAYVTLRGRRGGSALAAAAVNALTGPLDGAVK